MFLSHQSIEKLIAAGDIVVKPDFDKKDLRPVGLRVHLAKELLVPQSGQTVSLSEGGDLQYAHIDLDTGAFYLEPGQFVLGATYEAIQTPKNILALVDGRSTVARLGLTVHVSATVCDGTLEGLHAVTLEIKNLGNFRVRLKHRDPIAMMLFVQLSEPVEQEGQSQYAGQQGVTPPNLHFKTGADS